MTHKYSSIREYRNALATLASRQLPRFYRSVLEEVGETCEHIAKERIIGRVSPLPQTGNFAAWEPLKDSTIEQKSRHGLGKGGDPRTMLYATGDLHDSIEHTVSPGKKQVAIGTNIKYAVPLEYGSSRMPPRPFLGPAMIMTMMKLYRKQETQLCRTLDGSQTYYRR